MIIVFHCSKALVIPSAESTKRPEPNSQVAEWLAIEAGGQVVGVAFDFPTREFQELLNATQGVEFVGDAWWIVWSRAEGMKVAGWPLLPVYRDNSVDGGLVVSLSGY